MKKLFLLITCIICYSAKAQQDPLYAQYMLNPLVINPAYAGLNNNLNLTASYRTQWTGLEGSPKTINVNGHTSLLKNKIGVGLVLLNDKIGSISNTEINTSVSYKIQSKEAVFSFGMQAGIQNFKTDYTELNLFDPGDNAFIGGDRGTRLNIGAGAIVKSEKFFIGFSVPRLLPSTFKNGGQEFQLYNRHVYLMAGYVHYFNERIRLKPTVLVKGIRGAPASVDVSCNVNINAIHTVGVFTRNFNNYGVLVQTLLNEEIRFGYVFELPSNKSAGTQFTTHEILFGIKLAAFDKHDRSLNNF